MALIDWEDFDDGDPPNPPWVLSTGGRTTPGLTGSHGLVGYSHGLSPAQYMLPAALASLVFGMRSKLAGLNGAVFAALWDGSTAQLSLVVNANGSLSLYRGEAGTLLSTSAAGVVQADAVFGLEVKATISDTLGTCAVRVNGVTVITVTNQDTQNSSNAQVTRLTFGMQSGFTPSVFDDYYVCDLTGPAPYNDFLGNPKCFYLPSSAAGDSTQFTPTGAAANYQCVDEAGSPNADTDYVSSATLGHRDLYGAQNLAVTDAQVLAVKAVARARKDDAATREIAVDLKVGSTTSVGPTAALGSTYTRHSGTTHTTNPDTGAAWTIAQADAAQAGVEVVT